MSALPFSTIIAFPFRKYLYAQKKKKTSRTAQLRFMHLKKVHKIVSSQKQEGLLGISRGKEIETPVSSPLELTSSDAGPPPLVVSRQVISLLPSLW